MKIVINRCHGGFGLSEAAMHRYAELKGLTLYPEKDKESGFLTTYWITPKEDRPKMLGRDEWWQATQEERVGSNQAHRDNSLYDKDIPRDDPALIQVVEEMGDEANGRCAELDVTDIPDGVDWQIEEYDGAEWVSEKHRTW